MNNRKSNKSIIFLATLGIYLGLAFAGATSQVYSQDNPPAEIVVNARPLRDFREYAGYALRTREIDLATSFSVSFEGYLTDSAAFDVKRSKFVRSSGDNKSVEIAKQGIQALGDSGLLQYLTGLGMDAVSITVSQDNQIVSLNISSDAKTKERAMTISSGLGVAIQIAKIQSANYADKILLENMKSGAAGSLLRIEISIPYDKVQKILLGGGVRSGND